MEGKIVWRENQYMLQYFESGEEKLYPLAIGDSVELFLNDAWVCATVGTKFGEPHFEEINYGDGIGCEARNPQRAKG